MKQRFLRLIAVMAALSVVAIVIVYAILTMSLPQLDGEIVTNGVSADVTIKRDAAGIPVIMAANRNDLSYGTGYVHAQDRYFQMDLTRRNSAGELAALFGVAAVPTDKRHRLHRFRARAVAIIEQLPPSERAVVTAYTNGVNAGLADLGAKPFEYFLVGEDPEPWVEADTLLAVFTMYLQLNDETAARDIRRGLARQALPDEVYTWLYQQGTIWDAPILGDHWKTLPYPDAETYNLKGRVAPMAFNPADLDDSGLLPGSNNWAVAGALTTSGGAIVANDMHLGITTPNVWYRVQLQINDASQLNLSGVTLPGTPIVPAGSNGHIAWGNTNSYGDWSDAVIVRPGPEEGTYLTPEGPQSFAVFDEVIDIKNGDPEIMQVRETIWGPVLEDDPDPEHTFAISWIAHMTRNVTLGHLNIETAKNVDIALQIANTIDMPPQNFVVGDVDGNIGWTIAGQIPIREGYDPMLPGDWSEGSGWTGWVAPEDYPQVVNPESGRIWTANARVVDGDALSIIGDGGYDLGARAQQIRDGLFAIDRFSPEDMLAIQLDDRAVFLERWRELLLNELSDSAIDGAPARAKYRALVEDWIPRASTDSVGYRLVRSFRVEVRNRVFAMLMQPVLERYGGDTELRMSNQIEGALWDLVQDQPDHLLTDDYESWNALFVMAVDTNIEFYQDSYDDGLEKRTWGERNTVSIRHPLSRALPFLSGWLDMPSDPLPGDTNLPRAQGPTFGASERFAVTPGDERNGILHMPTGQSGHPLSDYYHVGHDDWAEGRASSFLPGEAVHKLVLKAAD
ncbi:MAG: penicillin acylase family protein [Woeseiaceae bacterium]|nr:penicillin acylase family protein [Woeseiaceae bacterium]